MAVSAATPEWPAAASGRHLLRGLLAAHDRQFQEAEVALLAARSVQQTVALCRIHGDADLALAGVYLRWRRPEPARRVLEPALRRWRETGLPGLHLLLGPRLLEPVLEQAVAAGIEAVWATRVLDLLQAGSAPRPLVIPGTGSALTPREAEVLRLLARGASNQAIAEALVVSLPTAKTHGARILAKLGAATRAEAATRARDFGLL
jgi:ATP/maltotriose-dependent transcriptional regulator MalT